MTTTHMVLVLLTAATSLACRPADQRTDSLDPNAGAQARENMLPEVVAQLDSGSQAFRDGDFESALQHYESVTELAPDVGAGWFGVYMTQLELGDVAAAQSALDRARGLAPGATLLHPDTAS
jgi:Flp pilus assembly protein TadD